MLDRTIAPLAQTPPPLQLRQPEVHHLAPNLSLYALATTTRPIIKLELITEAGHWQEPHSSLGYLTAKMLLEGTEAKSYAQIAEYVDQYGAGLHTEVQPDYLSITLTTLTQHLGPLLALLGEVLQGSIFPPHRLAHHQQRKAQALQVANQKNKVLAQRQFKKLLFGPEHPYSQDFTEEGLKQVVQAEVKAYHQQHLLAHPRVFVSGQVLPSHIELIQQTFRDLPPQLPHPTRTVPYTYMASQVHLAGPNTLQTAISIGKPMPGHGHPDYLGLLVLNQLLGGYFGSRLMRNIREDKGYTYGIHSRIIALQHASYLHIQTQVNTAYAQATCAEISREIEILQTALVPEQELRSLRNHMLGGLLGRTQHPLALIEKVKVMQLHGLAADYYEQLCQTISSITPEQLRQLAQQHLAPASLSQVTVG